MNNTEKENFYKKAKTVNNFFKKVDINKFYPYSTKPKIMILLKKIIGTISVINLISFFSVGLICLWVLPKSTNSDENVNRLAKKILINIFNFFYVFVILIIANQTLKKEKYAKNKYTISVFLMVFLIFYHSLWIVNLNNIYQKASNFGINSKSSGVTFLRVSLLFIMIFNGINIYLFILAILLNPKMDYKKINKFQKELHKKGEANLKGEKYEIDFKEFQ